MKNDDIKKVTFQEATELLTLSWNTRRPMLLVGPPASAKTAVARAFQQYNEFDLIVTTGATSLPTDVKGMPTTWQAEDRQFADFIPFGDLRKAMEATEPTLWILEDFTNSDKDVQKGFMQLLHERQVNEHKISDYVHIVATGNRREDKSGVTGLIEAVKTRFAMVVEIVPELDGWLSGYAIPNQIHTDVIGFLRFCPEKLYVHNPTNDMNREPNLRAWEFLSDTLYELESMEASPAIHAAAVQGVLGVSLGSDFLSYQKLKDDLPDIDECLKDPRNCVMPDVNNLGILFAFCSLIARRTDLNNFPAISAIAARLPQEYAAKLIFDCKSYCPDVMDHPDFLRWSANNHIDMI